MKTNIPALPAHLPAVEILTQIRGILQESLGEPYVSVRLEIDITGLEEWRIYSAAAGEISGGRNLAECVSDQIRLNGPVARAARLRAYAATLLASAASLEAAN